MGFAPRPAFTTPATSSFRVFDGAGRLLSETAPFTGTTTYDTILDIPGSASGNLSVTTRGTHSVTNESYRDNTPAGSYGSATHPVTYQYGLTNGLLFSRTYQFPAIQTATSLVSIATPTTNITTSITDFAGRQQATIFGNGASIKYAYDKNGREICRTDENGHKILTSYDPAGRISRATIDLNGNGIADAGDIYTRQTYAFTTYNGNAVFETDTYCSDLANREICVNRVLESTDGNSVWAFDFSNKMTYAATSYNGATRNSAVTLPNQTQGTVTYTAGRLSSVKPSDSAFTTSVSLDGFNRIQNSTDAKGSTTIAYAKPGIDPADYVKVTQPTGAYTKNIVDAFDQLVTSEKRNGVTNTVTKYDWNITGEIARKYGDSQPLCFNWTGDGVMNEYATARNFTAAPVSNAIAAIPSSGGFNGVMDATVWDLDPARRWPVAKNFSDGTRVQMIRDAVGNLSQFVNARNMTIGYARDAADQVVGKTYSDTNTPNVAYAYNLRFLATNVIDAAGNRAMAYDDGGRPVSVMASNAALAIAYCTNSNERAASTLTLGNNSALGLNYTFNNAGRLATITAQCSGLGATNLTFSYTWLTNENRIATITAPNGVTNQFCYQANADLVSAIRVWPRFATPPVGSAASPMIEYDYSYDDANRCTNFARPYESIRDQYRFDPQGHLVLAAREVAGVWTTSQWLFDTAGNRVAETNGITGIVATRPCNALNQIRSCTYDADGNLTGHGPWTYTWDAENRLTGVSSNGVQIATYQYDSQNRRISKTVGTATYRYIYDGWNLVAELITANGSLVTNLYVWGADHTGSLDTDSGGVRGLLAIIRGTSIYYPVMNNHGDVMALFDSTGTNIVARYERDPFGVLLSATGPAVGVCPFGFQSKYCDPETGLIYFGHRYYAPTLGIFISRDPLQEEGGVNLYGYGKGSPLAIDPLGLADLENHVVVGYFAMRELGISLSLDEFECFARGLILPDLPFADAGGNATKFGEAPLAIAWVAQMEAAKTTKEVTKLLEQKKKQIKQQYPLLDLDYWRNWTPAGVERLIEYSGEPYRRTKYWWGDSGIMGPVLTKIPKVRDTTTIRTHFGDLAYYHGMGDSGGSARELQNNIQKTVDNCLNNYRKLKDTDRRRALLNLGMAIHILTDTWTPGHVRRNSHGSIKLFQDYNVQSLHYHEYNDDLLRNLPQSFNSAVTQSALLIRQANGDNPINTGAFFAITPDAGIGIVAGSEQATFWNTLRNGIPGGGK